MKCPMIYRITQINHRQALFAEDDTPCGEDSFFTELQSFGECANEECMAYDKVNKICRRIKYE